MCLWNMDALGGNSQNLDVLHFDPRPAPMSVKYDKLIVKVWLLHDYQKL